MYDLKISGGIIDCSVQLSVKPRELFSFFSDANNLNLLTPKFLKFRIVSELPPVLYQGALIDYRLSLKGIPIFWRTKITTWDPPYRFIDKQLIGPYRKWHHEHIFIENEKGCLAIDKVHYSLLCGFLLNPVFVEPQLLQIFQYRASKLIELIG